MAVACMSGSFKGVFVQGVLTAFETHKIVFPAYGSCSSSALPTAYAAVNKVTELSIECWYDNLELLKKPGYGMSNIVLDSIDKFTPVLNKLLFVDSAQRFLVACSCVNNNEAAQITQSDQATRLGRQLLIQAARKDNQWSKQNLDLHVFDTQSHRSELLLTPGNLKEVLYATTRMLNAWHIPAAINGKPYIDGSYTCLCPVEPMIEIGYKKILVIATEPEQIYTDLFSSKAITRNMNGCIITIIQPDIDLKTLGVDFFNATEEGLKKAFDYGIEKGYEYIEKMNH